MVSMELAAPKDKQRASSRINWLLRQLTKSVPDDIHVRAKWPGRADDTQVSLVTARENPASLEEGRELMVPTYFDVLLVRDLAGKFFGTKTFIENVEAAIPQFYEQVGQHLRPYVAPPPKIKDGDVKDKAGSDEESDIGAGTAIDGASQSSDENSEPLNQGDKVNDPMLTGIAIIAEDSAATNQLRSTS